MILWEFIIYFRVQNWTNMDMVQIAREQERIGVGIKAKVLIRLSVQNVKHVFEVYHLRTRKGGNEV